MLGHTKHVEARPSASVKRKNAFDIHRTILLRVWPPYNPGNLRYVFNRSDYRKRLFIYSNSSLISVSECKNANSKPGVAADMVPVMVFELVLYLLLVCYLEQQGQGPFWFSSSLALSPLSCFQFIL